MLRVDWEKLDWEEDYRLYHQGEPFTGVAFERDLEGQLRSEDSFVDGVKNGVCRLYYPSGKLREEKNIVAGGSHGLTRNWYENGQLQAERMYDRGSLEKERVWNEQGEVIRDYEKDYRFGHRGEGDYYIERDSDKENRPLKITHLEKYTGKRKHLKR